MSMPPSEWMTPDQRTTLERFVSRESQDPSVLGIVLSGSLVRGWGSATSDVDVIVVVTDEHYLRRKAEGTLTIYDRSVAAYPDGAVDTKCVTTGYLDIAEARACEATRNAFVNAHAALDRLGDLQERAERIGTYPESERESRLTRFAAQLEVWRWYIGEADKRQNRYLASWSATHAALFACRVILAHNRMLFPFHKWMLRAVEEATEKPDGLAEAIDAAVAEPSTGTVHALCDLVLGFRDWPQDPLGSAGAFHRDTEQAWMRHEPGIDNL